MRFQYEPRHGELNLNITPLIDVVFLLIIFFLVTSSFVQITGVRVKLPEVVTSEKIQKTHLLVEIDKSGNYFFENKKIAFSALKNQFSRTASSKKLTISADKKTDFDAVMKVWDLAREHKLKEVVVLTANESRK